MKMMMIRMTRRSWRRRRSSHIVSSLGARHAWMAAAAAWASARGRFTIQV